MYNSWSDFNDQGVIGLFLDFELAAFDDFLVLALLRGPTIA